MAIAEVIEIPRGSKEKYDEVTGSVGLTGSKLAPGQLVHFAGPMQGGGWQITARVKAGLPEVIPPTRVFNVHRLAK